MSESTIRPCPNCGKPLPPGSMRCSYCGTPVTMLMTNDILDPMLRILPDHGKGQTVLLNRKTFNIGSDPDQDIAIPFPGIAPKMARLVLEGSQFRLYDLTSYPGDVMVNEKFIDSQTLRDGDKIRLQDGSGRGVTLTYLNPAERSKAADTHTVHPLNHFPFTIGRSASASIGLDSLAVSWNHARIEQEGDAHVLYDLESTNGTFVDDVRISAPHPLESGDVIRIDQMLLVYKGDHLLQLASIQQFRLDAIDLSVTYPVGLLQRRPLPTLMDASLSMRSDEFVSIIGGSGSGKSTLLRALSGVRHATSGKVLVNGDDLYERYDQYHTLIGYVPQADIVHENLTVYQALWFGARLRFPNEPKSSREQRIVRALEAVHLVNFKNQLVGTLSGGQRKRVSIATELMAEPRLLFMDEPSSGLDPGLDRSMMETLRRLANQGNIVVVVTHTTLNIGMCDRLLMMAAGNVVFYGRPREALTFFNVRDYAELYNRVAQPPDDSRDPLATPETAALRWKEAFKALPEYATYITKPLQELKDKARSTAETILLNRQLKIRRQGTFRQQMRVLIERNMVLALRDLRTMIGLLVVLPLVGLFLGLISGDTLQPGRGQMLVDRFQGQSVNEFLIANLPLKRVAETGDALPNPPATDLQPTSKAAQCPNLDEMGVFTPATDAQRLLFVLAMSVTLLGIFTSSYTIVEERALFLRERMANLGILPYVASKLVVYTGFALISCILLLLTFSIGVKLPDHGLMTWAPLEMFITLSLSALAGVSLGLLISAVTREVNSVTYIVLGVLLVQILFAGVLFPMNGALEAPSRLSITRWSLEALGGSSNILTRDAEGRFVARTVVVNPKTCAPIKHNSEPIAYPAPSVLSMTTYPTNPGDIWLRWGVLLGFSVIFIAGATFALSRDDPL